MKTLKDYIEESLLDIEGTIKANDEAIKNKIETWIKDNFNIEGLKISKNPNKDGLYEVSAKNTTVKNRNITSLTNGMFVWDKVKGYFDCPTSLTSLEGAPKEVGKDFNCSRCTSLISLKGAPKEVGGYFYCSYCNSLTSLEGAPKEVGEDFDCSHCASLKTLKGAPKEVGGYFYCYDCTSLKTLEGAPEYVGGSFDCYECKSLESLKGAPKEVGRNFNCFRCKVKFSREEVKAISNVKKEIFV